MDNQNSNFIDFQNSVGTVCRQRFSQQQRDHFAHKSLHSGVALRDFARLEGLNYHTLKEWRKKYLAKHGRVSGAVSVSPESFFGQSVDFVQCAFSLPAQDVQPDYPLEVLFSDGTRLRGADASTLAHLAKALQC